MTKGSQIYVEAEAWKFSLECNPQKLCISVYLFCGIKVCQPDGCNVVESMDPVLYVIMAMEENANTL